MAMHVENTQISGLAEVLFEKGLDGLGAAVEILINEAMRIERARYLNAEPYERTEARSDYANGFKPKQLKTRLGSLNLQVPQVREGDFYPSFLERGLRSERALNLALAEMYIQGVSTRKVTSILEELCGLEVTSMDVSRAAKLLDEEFALWRARPLGQFSYLILDARYEKVRQGGHVIDSAVLVAYGVDTRGLRHVLGVSVALSETDRLLKMAMATYEKTAPQLSQWMEVHIPEGLTIFEFKSSHRRRLRTSNLAERVNRELKRRTRVASIFPNVASCERLVTGLLVEISEGWESGKAYLSMEE